MLCAFAGRRSCCCSGSGHLQGWDETSRCCGHRKARCKLPAAIAVAPQLLISSARCAEGKGARLPGSSQGPGCWSIRSEKQVLNAGGSLTVNAAPPCSIPCALLSVHLILGGAEKKSSSPEAPEVSFGFQTSFFSSSFVVQRCRRSLGSQSTEARRMSACCNSLRLSRTSACAAWTPGWASGCPCREDAAVQRGFQRALCQ